MICELKALLSELNFKYSHESHESAHYNSEIKHTTFKTFLQKNETKDLFLLFKSSFSFVVENRDPINLRYNDNVSDFIDALELIFSDNDLLKVTFNIYKKTLEEEVKSHYNIYDEKLILSFSFSTEFIKECLIGNFTDIETIFLKSEFKTCIVLFDVINFHDSNELVLIMGMNFDKDIDIVKKWASLDLHSELKISDKIDNRNINCHWVNPSTILTPDFFWFQKSFNMLITSRFEYEQYVDLYDLIDILASRYIELVFISIANYTDDEKIKIIGHKTIEFHRSNISTSSLTFMSLTTLKAIYEFIYSSQTLDKLILTRNAISLNSMDNSSLNFIIGNIEQTYNSVQNNFNHFINNSIEEFIDKKLDLEKHARDTARDLSDEISGGITLITRNLLTLIGATIIGYAGAMLRVDKKLLFYSAALYIAFVLISSTVFLLYSQQKKNHSLNVYQYYSKINIYADSESKSNFLKLIIQPKIKSFDSYWKASVLLNIAFIVVIIITTYYLSTIM
ncbi:hypothetical protein SLU01_18950 [Sporosarcina luteola]|uniref:Uncharacterized protein n=1 Tax=Sporosarcina luteola TaxID=582850 RepID=A0A511Z814_9BACL|nr:hypothetical protein [Sporosarcina luteola]GEN83583.1 hypothetical protein SLU01_18950 [Sporosarcina luteola]